MNPNITQSGMLSAKLLFHLEGHPLDHSTAEGISESPQTTHGHELPLSCWPWGGRYIQAHLSEDLAGTYLHLLLCGTEICGTEHWWPSC